MFDHDTSSPPQKPCPKPKTITFMQNGHPENLFTVHLPINRKTITKQQLLKAIEKSVYGFGSSSPRRGGPSRQNRQQDIDRDNVQGKHEMRQQGRAVIEFINKLLQSKTIRIFSTQAVEYYEQDLQYLKNGDRLYISHGEQFDSNRNFGQYQIISKLGEGGFGSVDLAINLITRQYAAIKILKTSKNTTSHDIDMIFKQAQNLQALSHPNIVKILNCYTLNDMRVVIVMEYLEGGELLALLRKQKKGYFEEKEAKGYFRQIINGVGYCHGRGIVHRDLKLENILIKNVEKEEESNGNTCGSKSSKGKQGRILKITDFGISGVADRFNPEVDWGTLRYMSPEVLGKKIKINNPSVDIWACGVILYLLVTGRFPFEGTSSHEIMEAILKKPVEFPSQILLTKKCKNLIVQLLNKDPAKRITLPDITDHPWLNQNLIAMTMPDDSWNLQKPKLKTSVSQQLPSQCLDQNGNDLNGVYNEYDLEDVRRINKFVKIRKSFNNKNSVRVREGKEGDLPRKSIIIPGGPIFQGNGLVKIPKRLQKQKDQIIQQLRYYKHRQNHNKQSRDSKGSRHSHQKQRPSQFRQIKSTLASQHNKLFPAINSVNRKNVKLSSVNMMAELPGNGSLQRKRSHEPEINGQIEGQWRRT